MKYKVIKHFQWGKLRLEKGQIIEIRTIDLNNIEVFVQHSPNNKQLVNPKSISGMLQLKNIEKYNY